MKKQPDFRKLFYEYFGSQPKKINYSIRSDSNRYHDLIFLKSLIHDARFKRSNLKIHGKRLTIKLQRDCWELGVVKHDKQSDLYITNSNFYISPVSDLEWRFSSKYDFESDSDLWINDVIINRKTFENLKIEIEGDNWSLHLEVKDDNFKMRVQDLEILYLYSQRRRSLGTYIR